MSVAEKIDAAPAPSVAILGAGVAGICMGIKLKQAGFNDFTIYEKAGEIGGTWRENTYPGCSCDVPLHMYQFSFAMEPDWEKKYVRSTDLKAYLERVVDEFGLRPHLSLNTEIEEARFDERSGLWHLKSGDRDFEANVFVAGSGQLHHPLYPNIPGMDDFKGTSWHSAKWNHDYDLAGKHVGVIGTGASAIQFVPEIAKKAGKVSLFQRSAAWVLPRPQREFAGWEKALYRAAPPLMKLQRWKVYWQGELLWLTFHKGADKIKEAAIEAMKEHVTDPEKQARLTPDYEPGCKRVLFSDEWWPAMARDNLEVVTEPIERITENGIRLKDGSEVALDAIVYGTGFDTTHFLGPVKVTGLGGRDLKEAWHDGAQAHYGMGVSGFPNFYMLYGPNTNLGHNSIIFMIECQTNYVTQLVKKLQEDDLVYLDVKAEAQKRYNDRVQADNENSVFASGCTSWYKTESGRVTNNWANYTFRYWWETRHPDFAEYNSKSRLDAGGQNADAGRPASIAAAE